MNYKERMIECCEKWQKSRPNKYKNICKHYLNLTKDKNKKCIVCNISFKTNQYQKKFCSKRCKKRYKNIKHDKRRKGKGFEVLLPNIFPKYIDIDFHHIHPKLPFVIPLPKKLHQEVNGKSLKQHFSNTNEWIEFYYNFNVNIFLNI